MIYTLCIWNFTAGLAATHSVFIGSQEPHKKKKYGGVKKFISYEVQTEVRLDLRFTW